MLVFKALNTTTAEYDQIKKAFETLFSTVRKAEVYVIKDLQSISTLESINYLIFIRIPNEPGNYYKVGYNKEKKKNLYLKSLAICILKANCNGINGLSEQGALLYKEHNESRFDIYELLKNCEWSMTRTFNTILKRMYDDFRDDDKRRFKECPSFIRIKDSSAICSSEGNCFINSRLSIRDLVLNACKQSSKDKFDVNSFYEDLDLSKFIKEYVELCSRNGTPGVLTKQKIDLISTDVALTDKIYNAQLTGTAIVSGRVGSGKTLALLRLIYRSLVEKKSCRFITFNHSLVYDIKHCLSNLGGVDLSEINLSILTIHSFFFRLLKRLEIPILLNKKRIEELMQNYIRQIDYADAVFSRNNNSIDLSTKEISSSPSLSGESKKEIYKYYDFLKKNWEIPLASNHKKYVDGIRDYIHDKFFKEYFLADYHNILKISFDAIHNPQKFFLDNNLQDAKEFLLNLSARGNYPVNSPESYERYMRDVLRSFRWYDTVIIDEAQDCDLYEKFFIQELSKNKGLTVVSGGSDQLIRTPIETDWSRGLQGVSIIAERLRTRNKTFRQKSNIVSFVNIFASRYGLSSDLESLDEYTNSGRIIIDLRDNALGYLPQVIDMLHPQGAAYGCSDYENTMLLLPHVGFTTNSGREDSLQIRNNNQIVRSYRTKERKISDQLETALNNSGVIVWSGISEDKRALPIPMNFETRVINYESCRGLECWNEICLNFDSFFYEQYNSQDAIHYADENSNLVDTTTQLKERFAAIWCYMAMTRAIDTLGAVVI